MQLEDEIKGEVMATGHSYWQWQQGCNGCVVINRPKPGLWRVKRERNEQIADGDYLKKENGEI